MENVKFTYIFKREHEISWVAEAASDFALGPLPLHIHAPLLEDYAGGKIWEANFRYVTLPLSWSLYSFFYVLFFKYTIVN